ncbi:transcriptional regulator [Thermanaerovibrio velox DSM 12556]|uniref:Transcriptional regulator n=1 Tax=Thermanaerovibrio velox DSM 12556 TaxID=926567 RepID=H0UPS8_9BACT|nr:Lrp/AsnC family transcriptional regulator [Thermanaerovibrio velox]EHM10637.1 transcriptional regulator [Thermanaerovibrio velox DSM 12556]
MQVEKCLDEIGRKILRALQEDARISYSELGRKVGLSSPAIAERIRRMESAGIIKGYKAIVSHEKLGFPITAFIRIAIPASRIHEADQIAERIPEVLECHHVTGTDGIILKVVVSSVGHLEEVVNQMGFYGQTTTSVVLSTPIANRVVEPAISQKEED